jgi:hypothetical protein
MQAGGHLPARADEAHRSHDLKRVAAMKRVHVAVEDLASSIDFYAALFGIAWETFHTTGESTDYGDGTGEREARVADAKSCCAPAPAAASACCAA